MHSICFFVFFCNGPATTEIYTLSLHDALPIYGVEAAGAGGRGVKASARARGQAGSPDGDGRCDGGAAYAGAGDRKSTRLNSSHTVISYAVFCLKKKKRDK